MRPLHHDVVVVGDGPAGSAVAAECAAVGLDVVVIGPGASWQNTYATWIDDVTDIDGASVALPGGVFASSNDRVLVTGGREHVIDRPYGVFDNHALRSHLGVDERLVRGSAVAIERVGDGATVTLDGGGVLDAGIVIDARGAAIASVPPAWQTAYGVVVDEQTAARLVPTDAVTLMDWSPGEVVPSFLYAVPVADGWLIEETVLAADPAMPPDALRGRLVARFGEPAVVAGERNGRIERVSIPMGLPTVGGEGRVVPFGAAAGMIHPATGYSVAASLRAAPRVARTIAEGGDVRDAIWPRSLRRSRALHDYGLAAMLGLDPVGTARFFDAFFELPVDMWAAYLRVDSPPGTVAKVMARLFAAAPWSVRRELVGLDLRLVARVLRP